MKLNITVDQFKELTEKERKYLQDSWIPEEGDMYYRVTTVKLPDGKYETHEDIDIIHNACAGEYGEGVNIAKKVDVDKDGTILVKAEIYPLPSVTNLIYRLGKFTIIKSNPSSYEVTFMGEPPETDSISSINKSMRLESSEELCDALWYAYLVQLRS
jgi:hypothetical protein